MSPIEIQKLTPAAAASALRARDGSTQAPDSARVAQPGSDPAPQSGVRVEVNGEAFAAGPPVDANRVAEIRDALRDGTYPIVPTEIADALIAARLMLGFGK